MESENEVNSRLFQKSRSVAANTSYLKKGANIADKLVNLIKQHSGYSIHRHIHSGNMGKKTTLSQSDFVLVIFLNEEPPFQAVLLRLEGCIRNKSKLIDFEVEEIKRSQYSLNIEINGFEFDLYPAPNYVQTSGFLAGEEQQKKTLEKIKKDPEKNRHMFHSGLTEAQVEFFKKQPAHVSDMVRLAHYWFKQTVSTSIFDAKYFIELVMVHAALKEDKKNSAKCFMRFLNLLENIDDLVVVFEEIKIVGHKTPKELKDEKPLVIEPANPYNNIAKDWNSDSRAMIKALAKKSAERMANYKLEDPIDILFKK